MIKAIIFDWFGVCAERWIDAVRPFLPEDIDFEMFVKGMTDNMDDFLRGRMSGEEFMDIFMTSLGLDPSKYYNLLDVHGKLNTELLEKIKEIRNEYKTILITDIAERMRRVLEEKIGSLDEYFDFVVMSYEAHLIKKDPEIFAIVFDEFKLKPEECLFIDDRQVNITTARELGMNTILYKNNEQLFQELEKISITV